MSCDQPWARNFSTLWHPVMSLPATLELHNDHNPDHDPSQNRVEELAIEFDSEVSAGYSTR